MAGPFFEIHIRPMFRLIDRDHMLFSFDLHDYQAVVDHKDDILALTDGGSMPPRSTGGPWPPEWVALFKRWTEANCPRLVLVTGATYTLTKGSPVKLTLIATGTFPGSQDVGWFERDNDNTPNQYTFYREDGASTTPKAFKVQEKSISDTQTQVVVNDGDGQHLVSL